MIYKKVDSINILVQIIFGMDLNTVLFWTKYWIDPLRSLNIVTECSRLFQYFETSQVRSDRSRENGRSWANLDHNFSHSWRSGKIVNDLSILSLCSLDSPRFDFGTAHLRRPSIFVDHPLRVFWIVQFDTWLFSLSRFCRLV